MNEKELTAEYDSARHDLMQVLQVLQGLLDITEKAAHIGTDFEMLDHQDVEDIASACRMCACAEEPMRRTVKDLTKMLECIAKRAATVRREPVPNPASKALKAGAKPRGRPRKVQ